MIMQAGRNDKSEKRSFTVLDTAEMPLILYKDNASERQKSLLLFARVPLILYKDKNFIDKIGHIVVERIFINLFLRNENIKC